MAMTESLPLSLRVGVIGCGIIGTRRIKEVQRHPRSHLAVVADVDAERRGRLASDHGCRSAGHWKEIIDDASVDAVIVSTPNGFIAEIAMAALAAGKHVFIEKPPGRNLSEAKRIAEAAAQAEGILKIGFNHRYHPAVNRAHEFFSRGSIGNLINIRARYGHGGRPGYEKEWRANPALAGGGELTDQGVHVADLIQWFGGLPSDAFGLCQTAVWPISPLEDNAFGLFRYSDGVIASLHTSWTQWTNLFSFEIFGQLGSLTIEGLGGSYGTERLVTAMRNPAGGVPSLKEDVFDGPDLSWQLEWCEFVRAIVQGADYLGTPEDGVATMTMIDALYRSARSGSPVPLQ